MSFLERTLASYQHGEVITPHLEEALIHADWPEEYPVKVYNKERKFDNMYHPSSDITAGELELYYKFHPEWRSLLQEEKISPTLQMTFQVGSAFHSIIQSMLIHLGFTTIEEVEVKFRNEERMIAGAVDVRTLTTPDGEKFLVDIKSTNQLPKEAPFNYQMQLRVYQDNCPDAPDRMALVYIEKAYPHRIKTIEVQKDEQELNRVYEKWSKVRVAIKNSNTSELRTCCTGPGSDVYNRCPARAFCERWTK